MFKFNKKIARSLVISFMSLLIGIGFVSALAGQTSAGAEISEPVFYSIDAMNELSFEEETSVFANPERGWYKSYMSDEVAGLETLREQGVSVIQIKSDLHEFLRAPISEKKLDEIRGAFEQAKKNGLQVIFRAAYDFTGKASCEPESLRIITGHIAQLKDIFHQYEGILYTVQAGFLGPWGEWHSSLYGDVPSLEARKAVLFALMEAVPESRTIQVRRPMFIRDIFETEEGGNVITEETAYSGSYLSRTGYHDDSLLSTDNEYGTYTDAAYSRAQELEWLDNHDQYVTFSGETCYYGENSDPENAVKELGMLHAQTVHLDYLPEVIRKWKNTSYNGVSAFDYITARLGYRFVLDGAKVSTTVLKGGVLRLNLQIRNDGFANLANARDLEIVLQNGDKTYVAKVGEDPRKWRVESGVINLDLYFSVPSDIETGNWTVSANLPSSSDELKANPDYSVRLANQNVWDEKAGYNNLCEVEIRYDNRTETVAEFRQITKAQAQELVAAVSGKA